MPERARSGLADAAEGHSRPSRLYRFHAGVFALFPGPAYYPIGEISPVELRLESIEHSRAHVARLALDVGDPGRIDIEKQVKVEAILLLNPGGKFRPVAEEDISVDPRRDEIGIDDQNPFRKPPLRGYFLRVEGRDDIDILLSRLSSPM